ncbi:hypothetical protein [Deinococcus frigens]|nr:hypothetical protein [Deinococcus frigens]
MNEAERRHTPALPTAGGSVQRQYLWEEARRRIYIGIVLVGMAI